MPPKPWSWAKSGVGSWLNPGVAGLMLIVSAFGQGRRRLALFLVVAAAVMAAGPLLGVPAVDLPGYGAVAAEAVSLAAGLALAAAGFVLDRLT